MAQCCLFQARRYDFYSHRLRGVPRARTQIRCHPSDPDTADICQNETLWTFRHNFLVKYPSEARHKVLELQNGRTATG